MNNGDSGLFKGTSGEIIGRLESELNEANAKLKATEDKAKY